MSTTRKKWLFFLCSNLFVLLTAEFCLRLSTAAKRRDLQAGLPSTRQGEKIEGRSIAKLVQRSLDPNVVFELRPNLNVNFRNVWIRTNSQGFRGAEIPPKRKNTRRILAIGDSHLFGWGVQEEDIYMNVVKKHLDKSFPNTDWQVINAGIPGYNAHIKMEFLKLRAKEFQPDFVFLDVTGNDLTLPDFLYAPIDPWRFNRSFVFDLIRQKRSSPLFEPRDKVSVPKQYAHLAGLRNFYLRLNELPVLAKKHGFYPIVYLTHDRFHGPSGIFSLSEGLARWAKQHNIPFIYREQMHGPAHWFDSEDHHPSAYEHRLQAETIFKLFDQILKKA